MCKSASKPKCVHGLKGLARRRSKLRILRALSSLRRSSESESDVAPAAKDIQRCVVQPAQTLTSNMNQLVRAEEPPRKRQRLSAEDQATSNVPSKLQQRRDSNAQAGWHVTKAETNEIPRKSNSSAQTIASISARSKLQQKTNASAQASSSMQTLKKDLPKRTPAVASTTTLATLGKCDKCDGLHSTDTCPFFKKKREDHKDAWANYGNKHPAQMGGNGGNFILRNARCIRQPGDGSCLFHSLCYGLKRLGEQIQARQLRSEIAIFIQRYPKLEIAGDTLQEWVSWDANLSVRAYARRMTSGAAWGGGIEIAACALMKKTNIHVYEQRRGQIKRISCFDCPKPTRRLVHILYQGGVHYDALAVSGA